MGTLLDTCRNNNLEMVKYLVENGANIHIDEEEPLRIVYEKNNLEIIIYLAENGIDSSEYFNFEVCKYLISKDANFKVNNHEIFKDCFRNKQKGGIK